MSAQTDITVDLATTDFLSQWEPSREQQQMINEDVPEDELLYGGAPGGGMTDNLLGP